MRRSAPSVHDRIIAPLGRKEKGPKSARVGYPALFLRQGAATKMLAEIAALGPVAIEDLPERQHVTPQNIGYTVRRLVAAGLVRRYRSEEHAKHIVLTLNPDLPWLPELRALLKVVGGKSLRWPAKPVAAPSEKLAVSEGRNVTALNVFGRPAGDIGVLFGSPNRTLAVLIIASEGLADASTIARIVQVETDSEMHRLLDPIEADGVFESRMIGSIRIYSLPLRPWAKPLGTLAAAILREHPKWASRVSVTKKMMLTGGYSNRVHLRRELGYE